MARILIVDDEKENREALKRALGDENPGWELHSARNELEAQKLMEHQFDIAEPIDVLLTDLVMRTDRSGLDFLKSAKAKDPEVMAILFTAKEKGFDRYMAFECGAFDVVEKNIPGVSSSKELNIKTRAALKFRESSRRTAFLRRYFDPRHFELIERNPESLVLSSRMVTICFWDIRGFSGLCEILKGHPELISAFLKDYFDLTAKTVFEFGGIVDKFIGDGVMALFGALDPGAETANKEAASACRAALALRERFAEVSEKWLNEWRLYTPQALSLGLGCGIHTGEALVGNVGTEFRDQFTALGPHVNFASRIERRAVGGQIILSRSTQQRVRTTMSCNQVGTMEDIKNIPGSFELFELIRE